MKPEILPLMIVWAGVIWIIMNKFNSNQPNLVFFGGQK